ncbi:DUF1700 domain-containing protein [Amygdalobacter indicium]|jgi:hypothetical protein|uniref:DUF1700 domain-containing protein n=1 Tax=Amygdalobacter indicium TaxID=3029272 RepID=UPI00279FCBB9|nr:DUF1700 domain-containing protein [Amygdalobacter indicium]WEG34490.1 DUF1700 domain-containing protein [Amygdalobacter indicium]
MNREEYMKELARYLRKLPPADLQDALDYFQEGFDAVGEEGEAERIRELGSPKDAANEIMSKLLSENIVASAGNMAEESNAKIKVHKSRYWWLLILLGILAAPVSIPLVVALLISVPIVFIFILAFFLLLLTFVILLVVFVANIFWYGLFAISGATVAEIGLILGIGLTGLGLASLLLRSGWRLTERLASAVRHLYLVILLKVRKHK